MDLLTVHALGGKAIVFTQTKREADEVAASLSLVHPCEVITHLQKFAPCLDPLHTWSHIVLTSIAACLRQEL